MTGDEGVVFTFPDPAARTFLTHVIAVSLWPKSLLVRKEKWKRGKRRRSGRSWKGRTRKWRRTLRPQEWEQHARTETKAESEPRTRRRTAGQMEARNEVRRMAGRTGGRDPPNLG
jgi:hypothetical protein